mmetsp:Transcript_17835/g.29524  ORF Transcript_17835/g.29524 Transcript_17835/m.29524 type:complete len:300 (-) Transcript_17835:286-1185(-)
MKRELVIKRAKKGGIMRRLSQGLHLGKGGSSSSGRGDRDERTMSPPRDADDRALSPQRDTPEDGGKKKKGFFKRVGSALAHVATPLEPYEGIHLEDDNLPFTAERLLAKFRAANPVGGSEVPGLEYALACREMSKLVIKFGRGMYVIRDDIVWKADMLIKLYNTDRYKSKSVQFVIKDEVDRKLVTKLSGAWALVWLTRVVIFADLFVRDIMDTSNSSSSDKIVLKAYEGSMKPYHRWLIRKLAPTVLKLVPRKEKILDSLGGDSAMTSLQDFLTVVAPILEKVRASITEHGLRDLVDG